MGMIFLILVSLIFAVIVFTILDRNASRIAAVIGALLTFVITVAAPYGVIIGAVITLGVFFWAFNQNKDTVDVVVEDTTPH